MSGLRAPKEAFQDRLLDACRARHHRPSPCREGGLQGQGQGQLGGDDARGQAPLRQLHALGVPAQGEGVEGQAQSALNQVLTPLLEN